MRLFRWKKVVDEREEMEMMRIEHLLFWFVFWTLLVSIFLQVLIFGADFRQVAGEWCVFMMMSAGMVIMELKGGHFDYCTQPGWRTYLFYSLLAAGCVMGITVLRWMKEGNALHSTKLVLLTGAFGLFTGAVTYGSLAAAGAFVKYRRKKLAEQFEEE